MTIMVATLRDNIVQEAKKFDTEEEQQDYFTKECEQYDVVACDVHFDQGYIEIECGTTICLVTAIRG